MDEWIKEQKGTCSAEEVVEHIRTCLQKMDKARLWVHPGALIAVINRIYDPHWTVKKCEECPLIKLPKGYEMRGATTEELESVNNYIKSISKPTGVNFWAESEGEEDGRVY